jgi:hypothetical protein
MNINYADSSVKQKFQREREWMNVGRLASTRRLLSSIATDKSTLAIESIFLNIAYRCIRTVQKTWKTNRDKSFKQFRERSKGSL